MKDLKLFVTLWPSFPHFNDFSKDNRLSGIRLNSAMVNGPELEKEFNIAKNSGASVPLFFDIKGRQLRVEEDPPSDKLELVLNHPISVKTPCPVLFKAGEDDALLVDIKDNGHRLIFAPRPGHPKFAIRKGESIHIREPDLRVSGPTFTNIEKKKIEMARKFGFTKFFLSYVQTQKDVDEFRELVGRDSEVYLKIEDIKGLKYVETEFKKEDGLSLCAAMGDLYVEVEQPHNILEAVRTIIKNDPEAMGASRMMLTIMHQPTTDACDFMQLAWMYDQGFRTLMLCDGLCLKGPLLDQAVGAMDAFKDSYALDERVSKTEDTWESIPWYKKLFG